MAKTKISDSVLKIIRHNIYLANKYNKNFKTPVVKLQVGGIKDYKKLLKTKTKREIYSIIVKEKQDLTISKGLEKIRREINRNRKKNEYSGEVTQGGYYYGAKTYGIKEQLRRARTDLRRSRGYAVVDNVIALMKEIESAKQQYETDFEDLSALENSEMYHLMAQIKRNMNHFPDKLIKPIYDVCYELANGTIKPIDFTSYVSLLLESNGVH